MEVAKEHFEMNGNMKTRFVSVMMLTPEMERSENDKVQELCHLIMPLKSIPKSSLLHSPLAATH